MIDAETGAYGAVRVMVTMNQTGEAAGNAAYEALDQRHRHPGGRRPVTGFPPRRQRMIS